MRYLLLTALLMMIFAPLHSQVGTSAKSIIYVDVPISQPNVNDCYITSVAEIQLNEWLRLFPNPNQGVFNLEVAQLLAGESITISIFNTKGQRVYQYIERVTGSTLNLQLNLSALAKGTYIVKVQVERRSRTKLLTIY
jgi:hypothetical protein